MSYLQNLNLVTSMKKFLLPCLLFACLSASAQETFETPDGLTYNVTGEKTVEVADAKTDVLHYDIPATVEHNGTTYTVTAIGEDAFYYTDITSVTLPETIERIEHAGFNSCPLKSIELPSGLTYIGGYAFSYTELSTIEIPAAVEEIGNDAFFKCKSLTSITFNEGLKKLGSSVFYKCPLTSVTLPESLEALSGKAFMSCTSLASVKLPSKLKNIGDGEFYECESLTSIDIPATVTAIGDEAFLGCTSLTSLNIPAAVEELGTSVIALSGVTNLTIDEGNKNFHMVNGVLYSADNSLLYAIPQKGVTEVNVNNKCIGINGGAFWGSEIKKVTLPDGFLAIDGYAFCQCSLEEINFPSSLLFIGEQGFASTNLKEVTLPENLVDVGDGTFAGCEQMTSLVIPSSVKTIYNHAFHGNTSLTSITCLGAEAPVIDNVYEDYDSPFYNVPVTSITVPKGATASYEDAGWDTYFDIVESDKGVFEPVSTNPEDGATVSSDKDMNLSFDITFAEQITIVEKNPEASLRVGALVSGQTIEPDDAWYATTGDDKNTLRVWAADYDMYTQSFKPEVGQSYYMVIPAGVVENAAGEQNGQIVIMFTCSDESGIEGVDGGKADLKVTGIYNLGGQRIGTKQKGINIIRLEDGTTKKVLVK